MQEEVDKFEARLQTLDVVPTIVSLQEHLETVRQAEIDRVRGRLGDLTPEQEMAVEALPRNHQQDHAYTDHYAQERGRAMSESPRSLTSSASFHFNLRKQQPTKDDSRQQAAEPLAANRQKSELGR